MKKLIRDLIHQKGLSLIKDIQFSPNVGSVIAFVRARHAGASLVNTEREQKRQNKLPIFFSSQEAI